MNKLILVGAAALTATAAIAADLPSRAPPAYVPVAAPPPPPLWTGPFVGVSLGGGFGNGGNEINGKNLYCVTQFCDTVSSQTTHVAGGKSNGGSFAGGVQAGYNIQLSPDFVFGGIIDIMALNRSGSSTFTETSTYASQQTPTLFSSLSLVAPSGSWSETRTYSDSFKQSWLATARVRAGFALDQLWIYGTGGLAMGNLKSSSSSVTNWYSPGPVFYGVAASGAGSTSGTAFGWTAGAGAEFKLSPNWSVMAEYLYYSLNKSYTVTVSPNAVVAGPGPSVSYDVKAKGDGHLVKLGLNYTFWTPDYAPVIARY